MTDPLSMAASSFAVIGVADVVLRASAEFCYFLSDIKDAPKEVEDLRSCITDHTRLVEALRAYLGELKKGTYSASISTVDLNQTLSVYTAAIRAVDRELQSLTALVKKHNTANKSWGRIKWILDQRRICKSLEKFERLKSTLTNALNLVGWSQESLRLKNIERTMQENSQKMIPRMETQLQALSTIEGKQMTLLMTQDKVYASSKQILKEVELISDGILKASHTGNVEHQSTRAQIDKATSRVIDSFCARIDELQIRAKSALPARRSSREIHFIGECRDNLLTPLLLLKDRVCSAVFHILSHHPEQVSAQHLYWFQSEFEHLVSSAIQEAATLSQGSTATSLDQWNYSQNGISISEARVQLGCFASGSHGEEGTTRNVTGNRELPRPRLSYSDHKTFSFSSPIGRLHITVPRSQGRFRTVSLLDQTGLYFIPSIGVLPTAIKIHFAKAFANGLEPRIYGQINTFRLVEDITDHIHLMFSGSLKEIDEAFRKGAISPYDVNNGKNLCLGLAARYNRVDILQYLDSQGIGMSNLNALENFWDTILIMDYEAPDPAAMQRTFSYLEKYACTLSHSSELLSSRLSTARKDVSEELIRLARKWICVLKTELGYDFDQEDERGQTPLMSHLSVEGGISLAIVRLLLESGVDIHATDGYGRNVLQIAMMSALWGESTEILEAKITLLIELGVDIHHRNDAGATPSHDARYHYHCWVEWCRALECNGLDIVRVLEEDGELYLAEQSSVDECSEDDGSWESVSEEHGSENECTEEVTTK